MQHFNIKVTGTVQGVFYRASTKNKAVELGITGWVRNEPDGSVYIEAEGDPDQLNALMSWCRSGPARAKVDDVKTEKLDNVRGYDSFRIRR